MHVFFIILYFVNYLAEDSCGCLALLYSLQCAVTTEFF